MLFTGIYKSASETLFFKTDLLLKRFVFKPEDSLYTSSFSKTKSSFLIHEIMVSLLGFVRDGAGKACIEHDTGTAKNRVLLVSSLWVYTKVQLAVMTVSIHRIIAVDINIILFILVIGLLPLLEILRTSGLEFFG